MARLREASGRVTRAGTGASSGSATGFALDAVPDELFSLPEGTATAETRAQLVRTARARNIELTVEYTPAQGADQANLVHSISIDLRETHQSSTVRSDLRPASDPAVVGVPPDREEYLQETTEFPSEQEGIPQSIHVWTWQQRAINLPPQGTEAISLETFAGGTAVQAIAKWTDPHDADQLGLRLIIGGKTEVVMNATQLEPSRSRSALLHTFKDGPAEVVFFNNGILPCAVRRHRGKRRASGRD